MQQVAWSTPKRIYYDKPIRSCVNRWPQTKSECIWVFECLSDERLSTKIQITASCICPSSTTGLVKFWVSMVAYCLAPTPHMATSYIGTPGLHHVSQASPAMLHGFHPTQGLRVPWIPQLCGLPQLHGMSPGVRAGRRRWRGSPKTGSNSKRMEGAAPGPGAWRLQMAHRLLLRLQQSEL